MRLLTDPAFGEEFDTVVDEITDQYASDELTGEERERAEKHFFSTTERQDKLQFASELLRRAEVERGQKAVARIPERAPGFFEQVLAFWRRQLVPIAATAALIIVAVGVMFFLMRSDDLRSYQALNLPISAAERSAGVAPARVKLPESGLKISLDIPEQWRGAKEYRARLVDENRVEQDLKVEDPSQQTVTVIVPARLLARGSYAIKLFRMKDDGTEERVRGSYYFDVE